MYFNAFTLLSFQHMCELLMEHFFYDESLFESYTKFNEKKVSQNNLNVLFFVSKWKKKISTEL